MAERKGSSSPSLHSKGGAGELAKQVQRKFSRAQEKALQMFGKSEETRDAQFEIYVQNFQDQQSDGHRIYKDLKAYLNAVRVMRDASSRLFQSMFDIYELDWEGGEDLGAVVEAEDLLWNDFEAKLRDQGLLTIESYLSQFPDMRDRVAKRGRKLVDYDFTRHNLESLQNAKKTDDIKIDKAEEEMKMTKIIFEDMNRVLKEELPVLYDSRVGCYVSVFQAVTSLREIFYKEMSQNNKYLQNIMMNLKAQHPDKSFVVKNFSRGTLKRRSLKDALSPRSIGASFSKFHTSYSSQGTLRRHYTSTFRSDKGQHEPYSPGVLAIPARPKSPKKNNNGVRETAASSTAKDNSEAERMPISVIGDTKSSGSVHTTTNKNAIQENEGTETKEREPLPAPEQAEEGMGLDLKGDSAPESDDENKLSLNINYSKKTLSLVEDLEQHSNNSQALNGTGSKMEQGINTKCKANTEGHGLSCTEIKDLTLDEIKDETF